MKHPVLSPVRALALTVALSATLSAALSAALPGTAHAAETARALEQVLTSMQGDRRGITVHVQGQSLGGAVVKVDGAQQTVELRGPQGARIVVRLDRIDAVTLP